jgi:DNA-binding NtrC family response regulator
MGYERVLLVDDEEEFTAVLAERLQKRGMAVDTASSGTDALKLVATQDYDAIILDLKMPGMDGIETLKNLQTDNPDLQILLLTGHATLEKGIEAVRQGAIDVIEKPADIQKLMALIEEAANRKMILYEKRKEEEIQNILKTKGW